MRIVILIAIGGALGAVSRYLLSGWSNELFGKGFPYGTLAVNVIGSFAIGIIMNVGQTPEIVRGEWRTAVSVGFLGALTTFSTFSYDTLDSIERGFISMAVANVLANVTLCLVAVWMGMVLTRWLSGGN